jgi:hypothetical protein
MKVYSRYDILTFCYPFLLLWYKYTGFNQNEQLSFTVAILLSLLFSFLVVDILDQGQISIRLLIMSRNNSEYTNY